MSTTKYGFTLYCEGFEPKELVAQAVAAEQAGFDFLVISDHFHPWLPEQKHAAFAWSVLGAVAQATEKIKLATMVTCPTFRYHPVLVAQMAATIGVLSDSRFTLGVGSGERLNEHITGSGWPSVHIRHDMLLEAIYVIRRLWTGTYISHEGEYYAVDDAKIFDLPEKPIDIFVAASGHASATIAGEVGDGVCVTEPDKEVIDTYTQAGGRAQNTWGQVVLSWDKTEEAGLQTAFGSFRFAAGGWKVQSELPNPVNFGAATEGMNPEDLADAIPSGPDAQKHLAGIKKFEKAGVKHLSVAYPGQNQAGFFKFWQDELAPKLQ